MHRWANRKRKCRHSIRLYLRFLLSERYLVFPRVKNIVLQQPTLTFTFDATQLTSVVYLDKFILMRYHVSVLDTNTEKGNVA